MIILVVLPRFPYPLDKGDKLRAYHQIVELSRNHEVNLFALSHSAVQHDDYDRLYTYCTAVDYVRLRWWESVWGILKAFVTGEPLQLGYWNSRHARQAYDAWERQIKPDVVYCQMVRILPLLAHSHCRKVLDFQDALSLNTQRRMERSHGPMRWLLKYEYRALQRVEQQALRTFDATTIISPIDRDAIQPTSNPPITLVPNGVDTDYFNADKMDVDKLTTTRNNATTRHINTSTYGICFTGNMSYAPNIDAARYLVEEIMPRVWKRCPHGMNVLIAGTDPKPAVKALAGPNVTVSGRLDDIRSAYVSAKMFVAPMRIGSGMQNKLLEAMSMGLPCITTSLAATPLAATPGVHLLVGDSAEELANLIVKLDDDNLRQSIADSGHRFVQEHFSWPAAVAPLENILNSLNNQ